MRLPTAEGARAGVEQPDEEDAEGGGAEGPAGMPAGVRPVEEQRRQDEPGPPGDEVGHGAVAGEVRVALLRDAAHEVGEGVAGGHAAEKAEGDRLPHVRVPTEGSAGGRGGGG